MTLDMETDRYFQNEPLPEGTSLAGWSALVHALGINAPVRQRSCISEKHVKTGRRVEAGWEVYDKRYMPGDTAVEHLRFALRYENIDLLILKRVFSAFDPDELAEAIRGAPTSAPLRRLWYFYETLTGKALDIPNAPSMKAIEALEPGFYFTGEEKLSPRHRVIDNLLGTAEFCPVIRRTKNLDRFIALELSGKAQETIGKIGAQTVTRAASFMLLADSRASFEIEGERPPANRLERWGRAVLEAGKRPLNQTEIYRLHRILIGDDRFTEIGYRTEGVFLGERDHNNDPLPEFIGARPEEVPALMNGLSICNSRLRNSDVDPVLQAAALAFGFVYIHPLADGNGRLHRCLIHHVLAERKFTPPGMVFPVSSVMLDRIEDYKRVLQSHTGPLMKFIDWRSLPGGNVEVTNETADLYRYYDCTEVAEFLYRCVERTVDRDLPREIDYLKRHDEAMHGLMSVVEMPDRISQNLVMQIRQNDGTLSKKRRTGEYGKLTDQEVDAIEKIVTGAFDGFDAVKPL